MLSFVYLISSGPYHKIGLSLDPGQRLAQVAPGGAIVHSIKSRYPARIEAALHRRFAHKHVGGEWFALDLQDVGVISGVTRADHANDLPAELRAIPRTPNPARARS
jgi:diphthamide synthase subunit DPH2